MKTRTLFIAAGVLLQGAALAQPPSRALQGQILSETAPYIDGVPAAAAYIGQPYSFEPLVSDPNDDPVRLSVRNLPGWASFDPATGEISGTPGTRDTGTWGDIRITASDGRETAELPPFQIMVGAGGTSSASLHWLPPVAAVDGGLAHDLAGYRIYYGRSPGALTASVDVPSPGITRYVVENLDPGLYYFSVAAYDVHGNIGRPSPEVPAIAG